MKTPAIQNDFSYYRRILTRYRITQDVDGEILAHMQNMDNDLANRMSLFYANATPMLRVLSETTSKFVVEVSKFSCIVKLEMIWFALKSRTTRHISQEIPYFFLLTMKLWKVVQFLSLGIVSVKTRFRAIH